MSSETINSAGAFSQAKDLKNRILFTILLLIIYRLGTYVPLSGIDPLALKEIMASSQKGLLGMFNMFSGGAVTRMAIFALGIMPYISSSIIVQLLTGVSDYFKSLKEQGEIGRKKNYSDNKIWYRSNRLSSGLRCICRIRKCRKFSYRPRNVF